MTSFNPWNGSYDIPENGTVNTKAFTSFSSSFLSLERSLSSWLEHTLKVSCVKGGSIHTSSEYICDSSNQQNQFWVGRTCLTRLCQCHEPEAALPEKCNCKMLCGKPLGSWCAFSVSWSLCCQGFAAKPEMNRTGKSICCSHPPDRSFMGAKLGLRTPANKYLCVGCL